MLRYGIPPYRLPDRILKREIDWIKSLGIEIKTGKKIKDPAHLLKEGYAAILIAGGAPKSFPLGIDGEKAKGVVDALKFLRDINEKLSTEISGEVVVIGGGSTAFDAARSSIRLGAKKVTLAYRRGLREMPAEKEEIEAAKDEGVKILTLAIPKKIITKDNKVTGIEFYKAKLGEPDKSGRRSPITIENSEFTIKADIVIPAVGAMPDFDTVGGVNVTTPKGIIEVKENGYTVVEGIFAAGDVEMGPSSVVEAIGRGHEAARGINAYLKDIPPPRTQEIIKTLQIYLGSPICSKVRYKPKKLATKEKVTDFKEIEGTFTDFEAVEEAARCFTCGPCYACPVCLPNCPNKQLIAKIEDTTVLVKSPLELSLEISERGPKDFRLKSDGTTKIINLQSLTSKVNSDLCIGCGRCEEVCAYRAIKNIVSKDKRTVSQVAHDSCASCSACVSECPAGAITQGYMSDNEILSRLTKKKTSFEGVKAFMSYWSTPSPLFESYEGVVELMSARKPSPMFLIRALARTGRGLLVIKPDKATGSHYLPWEEPPDNVLKHTWRILKSVGISPDRIKYVELPKDENPSKLLKEFSEELDKKGLGKLPNLIPTDISSPFGEAMTLLRIIGVDKDIAPKDDFSTLSPVKSGGNAYFEGCLPMLHLMGEAHNLYNLGQTRLSIFELLKKLKINAGSFEGFSCPSKGLLKIKLSGMKDIVSKITDDNLKAFKKANPKKIIIGTPEAFTSISKDKDFRNVTSLVDELISNINKKDLNRIGKTIAIHKSCKMDNDPFYESTKKLLEIIPGVKIIELKGKCGHNNFDKIDGKTKQTAISLMKEATSKGAEIIVCTSPYCESNLLMCSREGSWRSVDIEISDVYQILLSSLLGET